MFIAKVVGNTWSTFKHPGLDGLKLLLVQPIDVISGKPKGKIIMAVDSNINAGIGELVIILDEGSSARQIMGNQNAPIRTIVAGIVDDISITKSISD